MVTAQIMGYQHALEIAIEKAKFLSRPILVSRSEQVEWMDPISLFAKGRALFQGERIYWSDSEAELTLIGFGTAYRFEPRGADRFEDLKEGWDDLLDESIVERSLYQGVGPLLLGGFSFDPERGLDDRWRAFPDARFVLPKFMVTVRGDSAWLTTNTVVRANDAAAKRAVILQSEREKLFFAKDVRNPERGEAQLTLLECDSERWLESVGNLAREIQTGLLDKVVLARELDVFTQSEFDSAEVIRRLREEQSSSYIFAMENGMYTFVTASPERLIKRTGHVFRAACVAGSTARGRTPEEDAMLGKALLEDAKNSIEHEWVVRMIRAVVEEICDDVDSPDTPMLYQTRDIQHLYTPVIGTARDDVSVLTMVEKLHPTPALSGYPREISRRKIREHEPFNRGWYGAPVGWVDCSGDGEFAVAIRSGLLWGKNAMLFAGCGIVGDSDPCEEYRETELKFRPMLSALGGIHVES